MSMILQSKTNGDYKPHPEGIHPAVCVDVIDLGLMEVEFQGQRKMVNKLRIVFESEQKLEDGRNCIISKNFTASLHPKAKLAEFLGKWRGRPIAIGETIDLARLIGACCTIVVSHQQNLMGQTYAAIDAISKPTKRLAASGYYDPVAARQRIEEWKARQVGEARGQRSSSFATQLRQGSDGQGASEDRGGGNQKSKVGGQGASPFPQSGAGAPQAALSPADGGVRAPNRPFGPADGGVRAPQGINTEFDPEVGF